MKPKFEVIFLEQAIDFMSKLDIKAKRKYTIIWIRQNLKMTQNCLKN